ncbi:MAG: hypothetical protein FJ404_11480 [Verrucomicrobia bacterium]|nr:hypothetical protein [Verrucomicrobiota bacterium]
MESPLLSTARPFRLCLPRLLRTLRDALALSSLMLLASLVATVDAHSQTAPAGGILREVY